MVLTIRQAQLIISQFKNLKVNPHVQNMAPEVNYFPSPFEGNINPRYSKGLKIYLQNTKEI